jgi:hypothetical protein
MGGQMSRVFLYSDRSGREVFRAIDPGEQLAVPEVGETIKLDRHRYKVEYVRLLESLSPATLPKEYRVRVQLLEERAQAATPFKR